MDNIAKKIEELREKVKKVFTVLRIEDKKVRLQELQKKTTETGFWDNHEQAVLVSKEFEDLGAEIKSWESILVELNDMAEMINEAELEGDDSMLSDFEEQLTSVEERFSRLEFYLLYSGDYDSENVILSIHSGAGGVDAQDWSAMLERMFLRYSERKDYKVDVLDRTVGGEAGIKNVTLKINGRYAYGNLKGESGVHRLVRISPFDADAARHTSFSGVEVIPELPQTEKIEINDGDIKIDAFKSSGPGGQGVNTTDSAIRIKHIPTNIVVTCQNERSQHQNKEQAMKILEAKLFKIRMEEKEKEEKKLKGEVMANEWGSQIRSYVMHPYKMVKDHRTKHETSRVDEVMDGDIDGFVEAYLRWLKGERERVNS